MTKTDNTKSIIYACPSIMIERLRMTLTNEEFNELKSMTNVSDVCLFVWNKIPTEDRPEYGFFYEWFTVIENAVIFSE